MSDIIHQIYKLPDAPEKWQGLLALVADSVTKDASIFEHDIIQHLQRAIEISSQIETLESKIEMHEEFLNLIQMPVLLLDESKQLIANNHHATQFLTRSSVFHFKYGHMVFASSSQQKIFEELLSAAKMQPGMVSASFKLNAGETFTLGITYVIHGESKIYTVLISKALAASDISIATIMNAWGLTQREAEIAKHVVSGGALKKVANKIGISYETIRTHLKRIHAKTGSKNQVELTLKIHAQCLPTLPDDITLQPKPNSVDATFRLRHGRMLSYCIYGPENGYPVVIHHTICGSRKQMLYDIQVLYNKNIRIINVDRPGYGDSTYYEERSLHEWPLDLEELLEHLQITKFALIGMQFGAEYALACSQFFGDRISSTQLISMPTPPELIKHRQPFDFIRVTIILANKAPRMLQRIFKFVTHKYRNKPQSLFKQTVLFKSEKDHSCLANIDFVQNAAHAWQVAYLQTGAMMGVKELQIISAPWGIDFSAIHQPVHIWHSRHDPQAAFKPVADMINHFNAGVVDFHVIEDDSVMTCYHQSEDILAQVIESANKHGR